MKNEHDPRTVPVLLFTFVQLVAVVGPLGGAAEFAPLLMDRLPLVDIADDDKWPAAAAAADSGVVVDVPRPAESGPDCSARCRLVRGEGAAGRTQVAFSGDNGRTWSEPVNAPESLWGDGHRAVWTADGRLVVVFRDALPRCRRARHAVTCWPGWAPWPTYAPDGRGTTG